MRYIFYGILIFLLFFIFYGVFSQIDKSSSFKSKRIACQEKTTTFENINTEQPTKIAIEVLESGNYKVDGYIDYSKFMDSNIKGKVSDEDIKARINKIAKTYTKQDMIKNDTKNMDISFYIYENDKKDSRKKGDNCKLYAGYIVLEFKLDGNLIYKIQTDYMKEDTSDLDERIHCAFKSFTSLK